MRARVSSRCAKLLSDDIRGGKNPPDDFLAVTKASRRNARLEADAARWEAEASRLRRELAESSVDQQDTTRALLAVCDALRRQAEQAEAKLDGERRRFQDAMDLVDRQDELLRRLTASL